MLIIGEEFAIDTERLTAREASEVAELYGVDVDDLVEHCERVMQEARRT